MSASVSARPIAQDVWLFTFPLKLLGADLRRNVTVVRLRSGKLLIHSTAPFSPGDVAAIRELGEPGWLLDGVLRHDTFAHEAREAFPGVLYLAPEGFTDSAGIKAIPILPPPPEWDNELRVIEIQGMPEMRDTVFLHEPSGTLIITELLFNFNDDQPIWTELLLRAAVGGEHHPGLSRPYKHAVKDEAAFTDSIRTVLGWDFDRIIVGHGDMIEKDGKAKLRDAVTHAGFTL